MNKIFMISFLDELEKGAFLSKQHIGAAQRRLKEMQRGLGKSPQVETIPIGVGETVDRPIKPGSVLASAKSMGGDIVQKMKTLKSVTGRKK